MQVPKPRSATPSTCRINVQQHREADGAYERTEHNRQAHAPVIYHRRFVTASPPTSSLNKSTTRFLNDVLGLDDIIARQQCNRKKARMLRLFECLLIMFSLGLVAWLIGIRWVNAHNQSDVGETTVQRVAG